MRVVLRFQSNEDNQQKVLVFGSNFVQNNFFDSSSEIEEGATGDPSLLTPLPPPRDTVVGKKRARESTQKTKKQAKKKRGSKKEKPNASTSAGVRGGVAVAGKERWMMERYERAELKVLEVMREKMAELGRRVTRKGLREEARKHIGDTGLLDHLLKHMAGKVVGDRGERFMRGYSGDGVMLYWLEPAEVEESIKKGEILEGCRCGTEYKEEIDVLKERIGVLTSDLEELRSLKELEKNVWKENYEKLLKSNIKLEIEIEKMNIAFLEMKENYERLLKRNTKLETEMVGMNSSFQGLKDELMFLKEEKSKEVEEEEAVGFETIEDAIGDNVNGFGIKNEDQHFYENHLSMSAKASLYSPQLRRQYPQLPCRGRVFVNCVNGTKKGPAHLSQLLSPAEFDQLSSLTNTQCTRQRQEWAEV